MARRLAGIVPLAVGALALGVSSGGAGVAAPTRAAADQTFTDTSNDSTGRLDIRTVRVTSSGDNLDVRVNLAQKTIGTTEHVGITFDFNGDHQRDLQFYFDGTAGGTLQHIRYPSPGTFESTPPSMGTFSGNDFGITFNLHLGAIGSPTRFDFYAFAKERDEGTVWDFAPDGTAWWTFVVQEPPAGGGGSGGGGGGGNASPDFVAKGSALTPNPPRAGDTVAVGTRFVFRGSGEVVTTGRLSCEGTIGSQRIAGRPVRDDRVHACVFALPRTSGGKVFMGKVTLTRGTREHSVERSAKIVSASELTIEGPNTKPAAPTAGQQFSAAFKVELTKGSASRRVTNGQVACQATAGGKRLPVDFKGFFGQSAVCAWRLPSAARGATFEGTITVRSGNLTATKSFTRRVR